MFRILALETSELTGSVAAAADGKVLAELQLDPQQRSAQSLAPAIQSLLEQVGWQPREIQLAGGDDRSRIVYRPARGSGDGEGLCLCRRGRGLGNRHPGGHRRRAPPARSRPSRWPSMPSGATWSRSRFAASGNRLAGSGRRSIARAAGRVARAAAAGFCRFRPGAQEVDRSAASGRYDARSGVLASHGRQRGPAGLSRLSGRPPRRSLEPAAALLAASAAEEKWKKTRVEPAGAAPP